MSAKRLIEAIGDFNFEIKMCHSRPVRDIFKRKSFSYLGDFYQIGPNLISFFKIVEREIEEILQELKHESHSLPGGVLEQGEGLLKELKLVTVRFTPGYEDFELLAMRYELSNYLIRHLVEGSCELSHAITVMAILSKTLPEDERNSLLNELDVLELSNELIQSFTVVTES